MHREVDTYEYQLSNWVEKQRAILSMFVNLISKHPELMDDYPSAEKFLDSLAKNLTQVLGESYTKYGYAFLVDRNKIIINHPNNNYLLTMSRMTDIGGTEYSNSFTSDEVGTFRDYTGNYVACLTKKNITSNFTVVVANNWWEIYGNNVLLGIFFVRTK